MRVLTAFATAFLVSLGVILGAQWSYSATHSLPGRLLLEGERADGHWSLLAMRPNGYAERRLGSGSDAVASPAGTRVAFVAESANCPRCPDTYVVATAGGRSRKIRERAESPRWSPSGRRIAYVVGGAIGGMASVGGDIYLMHADGQHSMPLAVGRGNDEDPVWSSDGTRLVYAHSTIGNSINEIVVVRADGEHRHVIARQGGLFAGEPAWSPRNAIAYSAYGLRQRKGIVVVTDPSGSRRLTLFSKRLTEFHGLGWSPGGLQLVLDEMHWTHPGGGREIEFGRIWIVGADGRHRQALTSGRFDDRDPVWSPDGRWVGFTRCKGDRCQVMIVGSSGGQVRPVPTSLRTAHLDGWTR